MMLSDFVDLFVRWAPLCLCAIPIWFGITVVCAKLPGSPIPERGARLLVTVVALLLLGWSMAQTIAGLRPEVQLFALGVAAIYSGAGLYTLCDKQFVIRFESLFFLRPSGSDFTRLRRWSGPITLTCLGVLCGITIVSLQLQPCQAIDRALGLSGCFRVFPFSSRSSVQKFGVGAGGRLVALGVRNFSTEELSIELYSDNDSRPIKAFLLPKQPERSYFESVVLSGDGSKLVAVLRSGEAFVWEVASGALVQQFPADGSERRATVVFSPDGTMLAYAAGDSRLFIACDGWPLTEAGFGFSQVAFSPDGTLLAASGENGLTIFAVHNSSIVATLPEQQVVRWIAEGNLLITTSSAGLRAFELREGQLVERAAAPPNTPLAISAGAASELTLYKTWRSALVIHNPERARHMLAALQKEFDAGMTDDDIIYYQISDLQGRGLRLWREP